MLLIHSHLSYCFCEQVGIQKRLVFFQPGGHIFIAPRRTLKQGSFKFHFKLRTQGILVGIKLGNVPSP